MREPGVETGDRLTVISSVNSSYSLARMPSPSVSPIPHMSQKIKEPYHIRSYPNRISPAIPCIRELALPVNAPEFPRDRTLLTWL